jgi:hypothetical protein
LGARSDDVFKALGPNAFRVDADEDGRADVTGSTAEPARSSTDAGG